MISNSVISYNGRSDLLQGGGLRVENSDITVFNNTFIGNNAINGGAISLQ